jgi:internalin A
LIQGNKQKKVIDIKIAGPLQDRRFALWFVVDALEDLHQQYKELQVSKVVPLPEQPEVSIEYDHLLKLEEAEGLDYSFWIPGAKRKYQVKDLLEGVRSPSEGARLERRTEETHFLDELPFDWSRQESQELRKLLKQAYETPEKIEQFVEQVKSIDTSDISFVGSSQKIWTITIDVVSKQGKLRALVELVLQDSRVKAFWSKFEALCGMKARRE